MRRIPTLCLRVAAVVPPLFIVAMIILYGVNLPTSDEWNIADLLDEYGRGTLGFADLFAQQNEYRQLFPNIIFVFLGWATDWDVRYMMLVSVLLAVLTAFNISRLSRLTIQSDERTRLVLVLLACLLIFSPRQLENWLQGQQLIFFLPAACLTACLLLGQTPAARPQLRLLMCAALCFVSTFSSANGIISWLLMLPALRRAPAWARDPRRGLWSAAWIAAFAASAAWYLYGYESPGAAPSPAYALAHPGEAATYFLSLLGSPLSTTRLEIYVTVGCALLALYLLAWTRYRQADEGERERMLPWLLLGAYSIMTAGLITVGRAGFGVEQSVAPRYITFTLYLPLACAFLFGAEVRKGAAHERQSGRLRGAFALGLIALHVPIYVLGVHRIAAYHAFQLTNQACALVITVLADDCATQVYPSETELRRLIMVRNRLGFMLPPPLTGDRASDIAASDNGSAALRRFTLESRGGGYYRASGRALLPGGQAANAVLLAWTGPDQEARFFAFARVAPGPTPVARLLGRDASAAGQWSETFRIDMPSQMQAAFSAWAFDALTGDAYRLSGPRSVGSSGGPAPDGPDPKAAD